MKLHADLSQRVVIESESLDWVDSPMVGVQRRMLERDGEEVARATSIVRYAPNSHFSAHTHGGGEEFLVLDGIFSDENGDYPAGTYIRNPVGSTHTPFSKKGCTILVKLWQMHPDDQQRVAIATKESPWANGLVKGLQVMPLHSYGTENVALVKWDVGTYFQPHMHLGSRLSAKKGIEDILNYRYISDKLATSGQPTATELKLISQAGYKTILNLAPPNASNALPSEQAIATSLGMNYINIPVVWDNPTMADFNQFCDVMENHKDQPIFVHCAMNMRVSAFMYLYRYLKLGVPVSEARATMTTVWEPNATWQNFIETAIASDYTNFRSSEPQENF